MTENVLPDGIVKGRLDDRKGTKAWLKAEVSCVKHDHHDHDRHDHHRHDHDHKGNPTGFLKGKIVSASKYGLLRRWFFWSKKPIFVATFEKDHVECVKAVFKWVTVKNVDTEEVIINCWAVLKACEVKPNVFKGVLKIFCPDGRTLKVFGFFEGFVDVNREVECKEHKYNYKY